MKKLKPDRDIIPGDEVGAKRWPFHKHHVAAWRQPRRGKLLAMNDPRAWANSLAFPGRTPSQEEVNAHLEHCRQRGNNLSNQAPVLWFFETREKVHWEEYDKLVHYLEDYDLWYKERQEALHKLRRKERRE